MFLGHSRNDPHMSLQCPWNVSTGYSYMSPNNVPIMSLECPHGMFLGHIYGTFQECSTEHSRNVLRNILGMFLKCPWDENRRFIRTSREHSQNILRRFKKNAWLLGQIHQGTSCTKFRTNSMIGSCDDPMYPKTMILEYGKERCRAQILI